ncbi:MAG TPA: YncE family protein [Candidatus Acidoferrum sp.]
MRLWGVRGIAFGAVWLGLAGACMAQMPAGKLLVVNKDDSALAIVDARTMDSVKVATGPVPHEVAASADGKYAVVTNYGAHQDGTTISAIDLTTRKETRVDLGGLRGPHGVVFFNGKAWFTVEGSKKIARYDPTTNKIDWTHDIGQDRTHMLVISKDGHSIYTSNVNSDSVTVVTANMDESQWTNTVVKVGKGPEGIDLSPDGMEVWAANSGDGTVSIIDTATKKVKQTVNVGTKHSNRLKFTPDGRLALISDLGSGDLVVMDVASRKEVKRINLGKNAEGIQVLPDGSRAFVAVSGDNKVVLVDLKTCAVAPAAVQGKDPDGMAWVPAD